MQCEIKRLRFSLRDKGGKENVGNNCSSSDCSLVTWVHFSRFRRPHSRPAGNRHCDASHTFPQRQIGHNLRDWPTRKGFSLCGLRTAIHRSSYAISGHSCSDFKQCSFYDATESCSWRNRIFNAESRAQDESGARNPWRSVSSHRPGHLRYEAESRRTRSKKRRPVEGKTFSFGTTQF